MPGYPLATCALPSGVFSLHVYTRGLTGVAHVSNQPTRAAYQRSDPIVASSLFSYHLT